MTDLTIFVCNKAYNEEWFDEMKCSHPALYAVIEAIIEVIRENDGGDISQAEVFAKGQAIADYVMDNEYKIIPSNGQELRHNGKGIRHAKYSQSMSVAILWEKIKETIYVTFDDHAPVRYHRAIHCLCDLRLGKQIFPLKPRDSRRIMEKVWAKGRRKNKGFDPHKRHYK